MKWPWSKASQPAAAMMRGSNNAASFSVAIPWAEGSSAKNVMPSLKISREQALSVPAVLRGRNLIAGTIASLPFGVVDGDNNRVDVSLFRQIDPDVPNSVVMALTVEDLLFQGISWWKVTQRGFDGYPISAQHVHAEYVFTQIPPGFPTDKLPSDYFVGSHVFIGGDVIPAADMIRFDSPNPALLQHGGRAILRALKLEVAADAYANDPQAREYFTSVDGADPEDEDVQEFLDGWLAARQSRTTAYVPSNYILDQVQQPLPVDLQLAQLQEKATLGLAQAMGLDPEDLGVSTTTRTYRNAVDRRQDRVNECYGPYIQALEDRLSMGDVTRRGQRVVFDLNDFLKANPLERAQTQAIWLANKVVTPDEVRYQEDMPPMTAAQKRQIAPKPVQTALPAPNANPDQNVLAASSEAAVTFSEEPAGLVFDMDGLDATFSVDMERRTITGLVAPFNRIGRTGGKEWMFRPGSLKFAQSQINRIKLLWEHDASQPVGFLAKTWATDEGQFGTFKVGRGPEGDKALQDADDKVRDGLSVGIGHAGRDSGITFSEEDGVNVITSAPWRETSLVALPAFTDARTTAVAMSAAATSEVGDKMSDKDNAAPVAVQFDAAALKLAVDEAVKAAFSERPQPVNPAPKAVPPAKVSEPPLYRFDGGKAQRCFTADMANAARGDGDARQAVERYMAEDMAGVFANISTSNVAALNPVLTHPEYYVPNLSFPRPLGSLVTTGSLDALTAFIVPKYSSSSGLVGNHTPGTEPTDGAFAATTQTITPVGVSGRVDVNREIIDSGGSPQADMLIFTEMARAYSEQLEKRIVAALVALSLSDTAVVGTDDTLQTALVGNGGLLTGLQFLRGGDRFTGLAMGSDLYGAVVGAVDQMGRPLFPQNAPENTSGGTASDLSSVRVGGHTGVPAWALETGNGGPQKSYLFVPGSVYQWASAPRRFDFNMVNVSSVAIAIWGYSAEAITRTSDVYQLAYSVA